MWHVGPEERRARLGLRHHLAASAWADDPVTVAHDMVGLHATDPSSVFLAAAARLRAPQVSAIEDALYEERTLVKMLGMRRTLFVVPSDFYAMIHAACTADIERAQRRRLVRDLEEGGITTDGAAWLRRVERATLAAIEARGEATAAVLSKDVPGLRRQLSYGEGKKWAATQNVTTRVVSLLAMSGRIVRSRPAGTWISSQHRWAPITSLLPEGLMVPPPDVARTELVRRWLAAFGPATVADIRWWTGLSARAVAAALEGVAVVDVDLDGRPGVVLAGDDEPSPTPEPWAALLPALDPTAMGWTERSWYLGEHRHRLFDRAGNVGPTVWWNGRIVGGWTQRRSGEVVHLLLEDVGSDAVAAIERAAGDLASWLGGVRLTPRFRTPVERELSS